MKKTLLTLNNQRSRKILKGIESFFGVDCLGVIQPNQKRQMNVKQSGQKVFYQKPQHLSSTKLNKFLSCFYIGLFLDFLFLCCLLLVNT